MNALAAAVRVPTIIGSGTIAAITAGMIGWAKAVKRHVHPRQRSNYLRMQNRPHRCAMVIQASYLPPKSITENQLSYRP